MTSRSAKMSAPDYTSEGFQEAVAAIVEQKTYNWIFDINASFLLTSGYLVFMMQLGFALVSRFLISATVSPTTVCLLRLRGVSI